MTCRSNFHHKYSLLVYIPLRLGGIEEIIFLTKTRLE